MENIKILINQIHSAAGRLMAEISDLDTQISSLIEARSVLTDGSVSRDEYVDYLKQSFRAHGERSRRRVLDMLSAPHERSFGSIELDFIRGKYIRGPFLSDNRHSSDADLDALYLVFGDAVADRIGEIAEEIDWPTDPVPVAERRQKIKELDAKIADLTEKRDALIRELEEAGLVADKPLADEAEE